MKLSFQYTQTLKANMATPPSKKAAAKWFTASSHVESEAQPSGTLLRGLKIIEALAESPAPLTLAELAERVRLDNSTVYRIVQLLTEEGYAVRRGSSKRYSAGPMTVSLLSTYHPINNFRRETDEILQRLREETNETILLILFLASQRIILNLVQGRENLSPSYQTWLKSPVHGAASGKVMLMYMPDKAANDILGSAPYDRITPNTITDPKILSDHLASAKAAGYAVSREETIVGITAVAAPILWKNRAVGCLTVAGDSSRLAKNAADHLGISLKNAADLISTAVPSLRSIAHYIGNDF